LPLGLLLCAGTLQPLSNFRDSAYMEFSLHVVGALEQGQHNSLNTEWEGLGFSVTRA
jgi:hypothetical protein